MLCDRLPPLRRPPLLRGRRRAQALPLRLRCFGFRAWPLRRPRPPLREEEPRKQKNDGDHFRPLKTLCNNRLSETAEKHTRPNYYRALESAGGRAEGETERESAEGVPQERDLEAGGCETIFFAFSKRKNKRTLLQMKVHSSFLRVTNSRLTKIYPGCEHEQVESRKRAKELMKNFQTTNSAAQQRKRKEEDGRRAERDSSNQRPLFCFSLVLVDCKGCHRSAARWGRPGRQRR